MDSQYSRSKSHHNNYAEVLPFDIQLRILSCMQIEDLFGSCLLVCKKWTDAILFSDYFARLQHRHSLWVYLKCRIPHDSTMPYYLNKGLVFQNGPYKVLNANLEPREEIDCSDKGIVCATHVTDWYKWDMTIRVGNPLKKNWKVIPPCSKWFFPAAMQVDTSTSPASFEIVATPDLNSHLNQNELQIEIFNSTTNTWCKYLSPQPTESCLSPQQADGEEIMLCEEVPILVDNLWPWVMFWKEKSCDNGIIQWDLMAILDINAFIEQHKLETSGDELRRYSHCTGDVITVVIELSSEKMALVNYDMRKGCWELGGLMEGACAEDLRLNFTPSLITV